MTFAATHTSFTVAGDQMLNCTPYIDGEETHPQSSQGTLGSSEENAGMHTDTYNVQLSEKHLCICLAK